MKKLSIFAAGLMTATCLVATSATRVQARPGAARLVGSAWLDLAADGDPVAFRLDAWTIGLHNCK